MRARPANESFFTARRSSPSSLATVVALHAAAIAAMLLIKSQAIVIEPEGPIAIIDIAQPPPPPPPIPVDPIEPAPPLPVPPRFEPLLPRTTVLEIPMPRELPRADTPTPTPPSPPPPDPIPLPRDPVMTEPSFVTARAALQPSYPAAMRRAGTEGRVVVRVRIGTDGRVLAVERISATHNSFFEATRRHALARWRFRPATRDGVPIVSWQTHTVVFQMASA